MAVELIISTIHIQQDKDSDENDISSGSESESEITNNFSFILCIFCCYRRERYCLFLYFSLLCLMPCYYIRHNGIYMLVIIGIYYHYNPSDFKLFPKSAALALITGTHHHPCHLYITVSN